MEQIMETKKVAGIGMMIALAFVLSYVESLLPISIGIPGVKIGLSNLVIMVCFYQYSTKVTLGVAMVRILLVGITFGNLYSMLYSLAGGMLSFLVMFLLKKTKSFSVYGVSMAGGVFHNIGQILVASVVLRTKLLVYYLPFLMLSGVVTGIAIGMVSGILIKRLGSVIKESV